MKKIYMILAAITLLSLSLNAQTRAVETNTYTYTLPNSDAFSTSGGTATLGDFTWTYSSFTYRGWDNTRGMQIGSRNNPTSTFTLSTSEIPGTITSITVGANAYNANATIRATVGGAAFGTTQNLSSGNSAATNTFTGSASGEIVITWTNVNNGRAMYFKSIEVTYETEAGDIATLDLFSNTTDANICLPVYGGYHDHTQHNQMVYPASLLTDMVGKKIKSMTFYPASVTYQGTTYSGIGFRNGSVTFKLMEVTNSTGFNSSNPSFITGSMTTVKTVTMPSSANTSATTWKITFDQEYEYNGGDLVIDVTNVTGDYQRTYFYTGTTSIAYPGYYTYSGSTGSASVAVDYVPKVTFTYENSTNPTIEISPETQTISDNAAGTLTVTGTDITGNISVSAADNTNWSLNPTSLSSNGGNVNVTYTGRDLSASTTVTASATGATDASATVNYVADLYIVGNFGSGWDFNNGTHMSYNNGIYTATLTANANSYILFARLLDSNQNWNTRNVFGPDSNGDWLLTGDSGSGNLDLNDDDPIKIVNGGTYTITIDATNGTFTIERVPEGQTATPTISYTVSDEYVTITATGDGTVTLNVPGYDPVSGEGSASITIPRGYANNTITVTATAQEDGKTESAPASEQITIPAGSGWTEMDGTYSANDLLSFTKDGEDIMLVDQFLASTLNNAQPDHYTYTLRQTVNGETNTSTPVNIPVYKTNSTMQGLYTQNQVTGDTDMKLKPNVFNTEMDYDVNPDNNVLYYSLYRSGLNETYPAIDVQSRISQLQKYEDNTSGTVQYFMYENHTSGVAPRYDHLGNEIAERLDTNWVEGAYNDQLAYVPVIWTFGLYSGREDGKNNSYGSDIKREYMGKVTAKITGQISQGDYGTWEDVNGTTYRAFHPTIVATGYLPQNDNNNVVNYNDGDVAHYVPYLCRAWCTNEGIHDYGRDADGQLTDLGELPTPFLIGEATFGDDMTATIGGDWTHGSVRDPWSFGLPASVTESQVTFKVRFYYKKVVTEGQQNGSNGKFIGGAAEEFFMAETEGNANDMIVGINEFMSGIVPVSVTYVNPQGMQSSRPFDGVNIVVTRYSDGTTRTSKVIR